MSFNTVPKWKINSLASQQLEFNINKFTGFLYADLVYYQYAKPYTYLTTVDTPGTPATPTTSATDATYKTKPA